MFLKNKKLQQLQCENEKALLREQDSILGSYLALINNIRLIMAENCTDAEKLDHIRMAVNYHKINERNLSKYK